jgi:hypothetical protein
LGIFQQKNVDARGHLVVGGPERHFFFLPMIAGSHGRAGQSRLHLPSSSNAFRSVARHGPEVGGALAFTFLINSLPDSITEPNNV